MSSLDTRGRLLLAKNSETSKIINCAPTLNRSEEASSFGMAAKRIRLWHLSCSTTSAVVSKIIRLLLASFYTSSMIYRTIKMLYYTKSWPRKVKVLLNLIWQCWWDIMFRRLKSQTWPKNWSIYYMKPCKYISGNSVVAAQKCWINPWRFLMTISIRFYRTVLLHKKSTGNSSLILKKLTPQMDDTKRGMQESQNNISKKKMLKVTCQYSRNLKNRLRRDSIRKSLLK